ncbi:MAG: sodium-dependent tyrosine transporter [Campylobacterota bacterium]
MFVNLNERVKLNLSKITRTKIDDEKSGVRVKFFEGKDQVAKSKKFDSVKEAQAWLDTIVT